MYEQLLFEFNKDNGHFEDTNGNNLGTNLKLYCHHRDFDNNYFSKPQIDRAENYIFVDEDNNKISVANLAAEQVTVDGKVKHYAVIDKDKNISSIESFFLTPCGTFYSVYIDQYVANLFYEVGFENIKVTDELFNNTYNIRETQIRSGFELLFFIYSPNKYINKIFNDFRSAIIRNKIFEVSENLVSDGFFIYNKTDNSYFKKIKFFVSNQVKLLKEDENLFNRFWDNKKLIELYGEILYKRLLILMEDYYSAVADHDTAKVSKFKNFLYFTYTDD